MHHPEFIAQLALEKQNRYRRDAGRDRFLRIRNGVRSRRSTVGLD